MSLNIEEPLNKSISMETRSKNLYLKYKKEDYFTYLLGVFSIIFYWLSLTFNQKNEGQVEFINIISISFFITFFFFAIFRIIDLKDRINKFLKTYNWIVKRLNSKININYQSSDLLLKTEEPKRIKESLISCGQNLGEQNNINEISLSKLTNKRKEEVIVSTIKSIERSKSLNEHLIEAKKTECKKVSFNENLVKKILDEKNQNIDLAIKRASEDIIDYPFMPIYNKQSFFIIGRLFKEHEKLSYLNLKVIEEAKIREMSAKKQFKHRNNEKQLKKDEKSPNTFKQNNMKISEYKKQQQKNIFLNLLTHEDININQIIRILEKKLKTSIHNHLLNEKLKNYYLEISSDENINIELFLNKKKDLSVLEVIKQLAKKESLCLPQKIKPVKNDYSISFPALQKLDNYDVYIPFSEEKSLEKIEPKNLNLFTIEQLAQYPVRKKMPKEKIFKNIFKLCLFLIFFNTIIKTFYSILKKEIKNLLTFWFLIGSWQSVFLIKVFIQEKNLKYLKKKFGNLLEKPYIKKEIEENPVLRNLDLESISSCIFKVIK